MHHYKRNDKGTHLFHRNNYINIQFLSKKYNQFVSGTPVGIQYLLGGK